MRRWSLLLFSSLAGQACGPSSKPAPAPTHGALPASSSSGPEQRASAEPAVRFEPRPAPTLQSGSASGIPSLSFRAPTPDQLLSAASLAGFVVEVSVELSRLGPGAAVEASLDGQRPRRMSLGSLALARLNSPERDLAEGEHFVTAAAVDGAGRLIRTETGRAIGTTVRFWIGNRGTSTRPPTLICWGPHGTLYGAGVEPTLDAYVDPVHTASAPEVLLVILESPGFPERLRRDDSRPHGRLGAALPWGILGLGSGDYRVDLALSQPYQFTGHAECVFTLNRETEAEAR